MKFDPNYLRFMTKDEFRVLSAIELGMRNHDLVPVVLIEHIAALKRGGAFKIIMNLLKNKLLSHETKKYSGYRLTYAGYDYLALKAMVNRGTISGVGRRIGVGKESDIHECINDKGEIMALKIHRLGRTSFRTVKNNRDYLVGRKSASWLYLSRLAAQREYTFMKALHENGFPVPTPYDASRHMILMTLVDGVPFGQVKSLQHTGRVYNECMNLIVKFGMIFIKKIV